MPMPKAVPSTIGLLTLTERQRELLALIRVEGNVAVFTGPANIPDWPVLKKVMLALGSKWTRKGFAFPPEVDGSKLVTRAVAYGEYLDPQQADLYETPLALAGLVAELALLEPEHRVLEPSAGKGRLLRQLLTHGISHLLLVDALESNHRALRMLLPDAVANHPTRQPVIRIGDFLSYDAGTLGTFDRIVMNPPFSKRADVKHVLHAETLLRPGWRLVAIMSAGVQFREDRQAASIRERASLIEPNPPGSFKESGTAVHTCIVVLDKEF